MLYATLQGLHAPELAAELVICDAVRLGGRGEFGSISVCPHLSFIPPHTFPLGMNDFHITTFEADYIAHIQAVFGAESSVMYGWCSAVFEGEVDPFFVVVIYSN